MFVKTIDECLEGGEGTDASDVNCEGKYWIQDECKGHEKFDFGHCGRWVHLELLISVPTFIAKFIVPRFATLERVSLKVKNHGTSNAVGTRNAE